MLPKTCCARPMRGSPLTSRYARSAKKYTLRGVYDIDTPLRATTLTTTRISCAAKKPNRVADPRIRLIVCPFAKTYKYHRRLILFQGVNGHLEISSRKCYAPFHVG